MPGLGHLKRLTGLRSLLLGRTRVTDACLVHVKGLASLEVIDLESTNITDAGLVHLKGLTNLSKLNCPPECFRELDLPSRNSSLDV